MKQGRRLHRNPRAGTERRAAEPVTTLKVDPPPPGKVLRRCGTSWEIVDAPSATVHTEEDR